MIDLYYFPTPNTWKVSIMLEEIGLPYRVHWIDIQNGEQKQPWFLDINPNGRVPAIVDREDPDNPVPVFESGAILVYLAEKTGRFLAPTGRRRTQALQWLFWQMAGLGPMAGQAHVFRRMEQPIPFAIERYTNESARLYVVLDGRLEEEPWLTGEYGIADMSCWGWVHFHAWHGQNLANFPNVARWFVAMSQRPAVKRAKAVGLDRLPPATRAMLEQLT
jgi:GSH-dependent disulfide-bond oxidoreductase